MCNGLSSRRWRRHGTWSELQRRKPSKISKATRRLSSSQAYVIPKRSFTMHGLAVVSRLWVGPAQGTRHIRRICTAAATTTVPSLPLVSAAHLHTHAHAHAHAHARTHTRACSVPRRTRPFAPAHALRVRCKSSQTASTASAASEDEQDDGVKLSTTSNGILDISRLGPSRVRNFRYSSSQH